MTCKIGNTLRMDWYAATQAHGCKSTQYSLALALYQEHRAGCMTCKAELAQPKPIKLFEVTYGATN